MRTLARLAVAFAALVSLASGAHAVAPLLEEMPAGSAPGEQIEQPAHSKQLNCGLYMSGAWTYALDPNTGTAYVTLAAINNDSFGCENPTGTLRLEFWAVTTANLPSVRGGAFFGQRIATFPVAGQLFAGFSFVNNNGNAPYVPPGYGTYWIVLSLSEFSPGCGNADNFCTTDNLVSNATTTIGNSALNVSKAGTGSGTVSSNPSGINCGTTCAASYFGGNNVTLTATPAQGSSFAGWSGACSGTSTCTVSMNTARNVIATFSALPPALNTLTVTRIGQGTVASTPSGVNCGTTCAVNFFSPTSVTLSQTPAAGYSFSGWSGDCSGTGGCTVTMNAPRNVTATFAVVPGGDTDGDGIPNSIEAGEGRNPNVKDNDVFTGNRLFVMQQYRDFLGREGDAGGIQYSTNLLATGAAVRANVIESFFASPEFQGVGSPVARLYFATFLRTPDYPGLIFQINVFRSGASLAAIATNFTLSGEFQTRYGTLNNSQFVSLLYTNILGRTPAAAELNFHVARLTAGTTRGELLVGFSESPEYVTNTAHDVYVTMMYVGMLRRAPEQAGLDYWTNYMDAGNPGINLILGFLNAAEYRNRFLP